MNRDCDIIDIVFFSAFHFLLGMWVAGTFLH